jgi:biopolymer transport protein ExbD
MAMRFSENEEESIVAEINITPLTDIFLVLLIIFMISSSAMLESGLNVKLPTAKGVSVATDSKDTKPTYVTVGADGQISINEKSVGEGDLQQELQKALGQGAEKIVIIRGDESIVLGKAVKIMEAARNAGAEKIALATKNPEK